MNTKIYCVGSFHHPKIVHEDITLSYSDYLIKRGFNIINEHSETLDDFANHMQNLEEITNIIIDVSGNCGYNVPWDIGFFHGTFRKKNENKRLLILKIEDEYDDNSRCRMEYSIRHMEESLGAIVIKNEIQLKIAERYLIPEVGKISKKIVQLKNFTNYF